MFIILIILGLIALPVLINLDYGGSIGNTFNFRLTQSEKARRQNKGRG